MKSVVGIDPSLSNTAVCVYDGTDFATTCFPTKPTGRLLRHRIDRYCFVAAGVCKLLVEAQRPTLVLIEGYGFRSQAANAQGEFGGILRFLINSALPTGLHNVAEVAPATLKKFAAGKGNAKKIAMVAALTKRYDVLFETDDEYDAYALARMAACLAGIEEPQTQQQRTAMETVRKSAGIPTLAEGTEEVTLALSKDRHGYACQLRPLKTGN